MILINNVCSGIGGIIVVKHNCLVGISDTPIGHKFYCTMYIIVLYFSTLETAEIRKRIKERMVNQRSKEYDPSLSLLIPQEGLFV